MIQWEHWLLELSKIFDLHRLVQLCRRYSYRWHRENHHTMLRLSEHLLENIWQHHFDRYRREYCRFVERHQALFDSVDELFLREIMFENHTKENYNEMDSRLVRDQDDFSLNFLLTKLLISLLSDTVSKDKKDIFHVKH